MIKKFNLEMKLAHFMKKVPYLAIECNVDNFDISQTVFPPIRITFSITMQDCRQNKKCPLEHPFNAIVFFLILMSRLIFILLACVDLSYLYSSYFHKILAFALFLNLLIADRIECLL